MPLYGTAWSIKTIAESNDQGSWYNYKVDRVTEISKELEAMMLEARTMYQSFRKGEIKMAAASADEMASNKSGEEVPF
jgi:adenylate cyclase